MDRGQLDLLSRSLRARGSRRRYKPIERLRKIFAVDDRQAREMGEMITRLAQDALQAWKASNAGREEQSLRKGVRKERCALAKAAADAERLCMESLLTFAAEMDAKWVAENLGSCRVWHILASKRRRRLPDFGFSPYHKYAHTLASAGR